MMSHLHKLPPLLEFPIEGQLEIILSGIELQPSLKEQQNVLLQTKWWGDNIPCCFRIDSCGGSARMSFGVCCDDQSFRQYLQDAQKLVFTLQIEDQPSVASQHLLESAVDQHHQSVKTAVARTPPNPVAKAGSPSQRLEEGGPVPSHLIGTPRHRLLEKKRTRWCSGDEVGECTLTNLKLNPRGELVQQCYITNRFTDVLGSINVTMIYTHDIESLEPVLSESKDDARDTSADCSSVLHSELYDDIENKENVMTANEWDNERLESSKLPPIFYRSTVNDGFNDSRVLRTRQAANESQVNVSTKRSNVSLGIHLPSISTKEQDISIHPKPSSDQDFTRPKVFELPTHSMNARPPLHMNALGYSRPDIHPQQGNHNVLHQTAERTERTPSAHTVAAPQSFVTRTVQSLHRSSLPIVSLSNLQRSPNFVPQTSNPIQQQNVYDQDTVINDSVFSHTPPAHRLPNTPQEVHAPEFTAEHRPTVASYGYPHLAHPTSSDSSDDTLSDESIVNYLRQLDPNALIECGALRVEDLSKFLKIIRDNTLESIDGTSPHPTSDNVSTSSLHARSVMPGASVGDPRVTDANASTRPPSSSNTQSIDQNHLLAGNSYQLLTTLQSAVQNGVSGSVSSGQRYVSSTGRIAPQPSPRVSSATRDDRPSAGQSTTKTGLPSMPQESSERSFSMRAVEKRQSCGEPSEYSGISLPSGVWPLAPDDRACDGTLVTERRPPVQILHGIAQPNFKLPSFKYKAIGPDGKELVMDSNSLARLTSNKYTLEHYHPIDSGCKYTKEPIPLDNRSGYKLELQQQLLSVGAHTVQGKNRGSYGKAGAAVVAKDDDDDSLSVASDETYTTSSINPNTGDPGGEGVSSPGSLLVVEVGELTVQGASTADPTANRFNLKGVRDRSNVCLLTTLNVTLPNSSHPDSVPQDQQAELARLSETASDARLEEEGITEGLDDPQRQSVTLASRRLQNGKVQYGSVEVFSLSGLTAPEHLQRSSLQIRVFRRLLGQRESELLCDAQLSLWDVYRLPYGHVTIPLAPSHSDSAATVTRHGAVDTTSPVTDALTGTSDLHHRRGRTKGLQVSRAPGPKSPAKRRGIAQNVRSSRLGSGPPPAAARKRSDERKPVSGEITLFLKLFLNEQYVDELRHSIIEDPSVINSFISERDYPKIVHSKVSRNDHLQVLTIPPNYSLSHAAATHKALVMDEGGMPNVNRSSDIKETGCAWHRDAANVEVVESILATPPVGTLVTREDKTVLEKASRPVPFVPIVADIPQPTTKYPVVQQECRQAGIAGGNRSSGIAGDNLTSGIAGDMRANAAGSMNAGIFNTSRHTEQSNPLTDGYASQQAIPSSYLSSHRSDRSNYSSKMPESVHSNPSHQPQLTSTEYSSSTPDLHFVQSSVNNPSVSFIQTLSQKFHQNNEYMIRIHIEILEARDLRLMSECVGPYGGQQQPTETPSAYVRGTFFGTDVVTRLHCASSHPKWNFSDDIIVSSSDINNARACVVLRVYHQSDHMTAATASGFCTPPSHPLIGCLALRPPTPFWPGQVSLCGWYPLLDIKGRMAGHVKLSLTIVESLLNEASAVQYHQYMSSNAAKFVDASLLPLSLQVNPNGVGNRISSQGYVVSNPQGVALPIIDPEIGVMSSRSAGSDSFRVSPEVSRPSSFHLIDSSSFQVMRNKQTCSVPTPYTQSPLLPPSQHSRTLYSVLAPNSDGVPTSTRKCDVTILQRSTEQSRYISDNKILPTNLPHRVPNSTAFAETAVNEVAGTSVMTTEHQTTNYSSRSPPQTSDVHTKPSSSLFPSNDGSATERLSSPSYEHIPPLLLLDEDVPTRDTTFYREGIEILPPPPIYADDAAASVNVPVVADMYRDQNLAESRRSRNDVFSPPDRLYPCSNSSSNFTRTTNIYQSNDIPYSGSPVTGDPVYVTATNDVCTSPFEDIKLPDNSRVIAPSTNRRSKSDVLISYSRLYPNKMRTSSLRSPEAVFLSPLSSSNAADLSYSEHCSVISSCCIPNATYVNDRAVSSNVEVTWTNNSSISSLSEFNRLAPTNVHVNSCLKTVDSPRGLSKKVKFLDEQFIIRDGEGTFERSTESALFVPRLEGKSAKLQHEFKVNEGLQIEDLEELNASDLDKPGGIKDVQNILTSTSKNTPGKVTLPPETTVNYSLTTDNFSRVSVNLPDQEPRSTFVSSSRTPVRPDITDLVQTLSWMNVAKDADSPCMSYIDTKKQCSQGTTSCSGPGTFSAGVGKEVSPRISSNPTEKDSMPPLLGVALQETSNSISCHEHKPQGASTASLDHCTEGTQTKHKIKATSNSIHRKSRVVANFSKRK